jgi:hypothetical protein
MMQVNARKELYGTRKYDQWQHRKSAFDLNLVVSLTAVSMNTN